MVNFDICFAILENISNSISGSILSLSQILKSASSISKEVLGLPHIFFLKGNLLMSPLLFKWALRYFMYFLPRSMSLYVV